MFATVFWGSLSLYLAWTIAADARDLRTGAEKRLVRVNPSELVPADPPQTVFWTEGHLDRRSAPLLLRRGQYIVVFPAQEEQRGLFLGRVVDNDRCREISAKIGHPCLFVVRTASSAASHFVQLLLLLPVFLLFYLLTCRILAHKVDASG